MCSLQCGRWTERHWGLGTDETEAEVWGCPKEVRYQDVNCVGMERRLDTGQVSTPDWWFGGKRRI